MYRVVGVDTFDGTDWMEGDFNTIDEAVTHISERIRDMNMLVMHVYDDQGRHVMNRGKF